MKTQILSKEQFESPDNQSRDNAIVGYQSYMKEGDLGGDKSTMKKDSCRSNCDQSDWKKGGKCDREGCFYES